jgi:hypothetical protein
MSRKSGREQKTDGDASGVEVMLWATAERLCANPIPRPNESFLRDRHHDIKADYILANPLFNMSDWVGERPPDDLRWGLGVPPAGKADSARVQNVIRHLVSTGTARFVLGNSNMSSNFVLTKPPTAEAV